MTESESLTDMLAFYSQEHASNNLPESLYAGKLLELENAINESYYNMNVKKASSYDKKKEEKTGILNSIINLLFRKYEEKRAKMAERGELESHDKNLYYHAGLWVPKLLKITNHIKILGAEENLPKIGRNGFIVVANHQYSLDPIYLSCGLFTKDYARRVRWISKKENFDSKVFRMIIEPLGVISLDENRKLTSEAVSAIYETLDNNDGVGIFPEGTRVKNGELGEFHTGAARFCLEKKVPFIPIALLGKAKPFKGRVTIHVGEPVHLSSCVTESYNNTSNENKRIIAKIIANDMRERVKSLLTS